LDLRILLVVTAVAVLCRLVVSWLSVGTSMSLSIPNAENWQDYFYAYLPSVQAFKSGYLPYVDFYFAYPPLFLYVLAAFSYLGASWGAAVPLVVADALTVVPVYLIARRLASEKGALLVGLLFALAPMNLYYADYLWLNPPLTTLFLLVSVWLFLASRYDLSAVALALSVGFKQTALLALPVLLIFLWRRTSRGLALRYLLLVTAICLALSIPYLFLSPARYLFSIFRLPLDSLGLPQNYYQLIAPTGPVQTVNTATITGYLQTWTRFQDINGPASLILPIFIFFVPSASSVLYSEAGVGLTVVLATAYLLLLYRAYGKHRILDETVLFYVMSGLLILFTFDPLYKYYVVGITPLLALLVRDKRGVFGFISLNLALLLVPRVLGSYVPLITLLCLVGLARFPWGRRLPANSLPLPPRE
jgi:4-amino-4-deoxy-L-arabinose transferase-like glycosyltransferase